MQVLLYARQSDTVGSIVFHHVDSVRSCYPFIRLRAQGQKSLLAGEIFAVKPHAVSIVVDDVLGSGPEGHIVNHHGKTPADL